MTRARDAVTGVLYLVLIAALILLSIAVYNKVFSNVVRVSVSTDDIGSSLQKGSDVEVRGILIGSVTGVHTDGNGARIDVAIDKGRADVLPADVTAELLPKTLFGERYVSLVMPADPTGTLHGGEVIEQDTSAQSIELQQVFDHLLPVLQAVQPDKLSTLLGELSLTLRDRGTELGQTVTTFASYLQEFAPKVPEFTADIAALGRVATTYTAAAPDLLSALDDFTVTSKTLVDDRQQLADTFATVQAASNTVGGVLTVNQQNIISLSADSRPSLQVLAAYSSEFPCVAQALSDYVPVADKAFGVGTSEPGLHVTLQIVPSLGRYLPGQRISSAASGPPTCPYVPGDDLTATAAGTSLSSPATGRASSPARAAGLPAASTLAATGIGTANSPQENELIAELEAPTVGMAPSAYPRWSSLLLGPLLRGTQVTVR